MNGMCYSTVDPYYCILYNLQKSENTIILSYTKHSGSFVLVVFALEMMNESGNLLCGSISRSSLLECAAIYAHYLHIHL